MTAPPATVDDTRRLTIVPVTAENWRRVYAVQVAEEQQAFVMPPGYYLALCAYGGLWQPLAIVHDGAVVGFMMWAVDPVDGACWLGGIQIDRAQQRRGLGRQALVAALAMLEQAHGFRHFALSYQPANVAAARLYAGLGFVETDEWEDDEIVARLSRTAG